MDKCKNCGRELRKAPCKDGFVGFFPCPCDKILFDENIGSVNPGTEEHDILISSGNYTIMSVYSPR